jgi:hypothetical protein
MIKLSKKLFITLGLTSLIVFGALASMPAEPELCTNLKVLPKKMPKEQVEKLMRVWSKGLGVRCNFCHERGNDALDTKPEKLMAREMYKMTAKINSKYFKAKKDSTGMMMETGVACVTCHHGAAHPEGGMMHMDAEKK